MEQGVAEHLHAEFYQFSLYQCNFSLHPAPICIAKRLGWPLPNPMKNPVQEETVVRTKYLKYMLATVELRNFCKMYMSS